MLVIRSTQDELNNFMNKIEHKLLSASPPEEIGQFVVNIDCISHANHSDGCAESEERNRKIGMTNLKSQVKEE